MFIDDCVQGTQRIMNSNIDEPINLGSSELVSINQLVDVVEEIAGIRLARTYQRNAPKGVNGRNSDNTLILDRLGWEPSIRLREGLERTYRWIESEMAEERSERSEQRTPAIPCGSSSSTQLAYSSRA
jgi:GDP-D-mannose 3',5'-epimerase